MRCNPLIKISKKEALTLNKECGVVYGSGGLSHDIKRRHYFLCENKDNLDALNTVRESNLCKDGK